MAKKMNTEKPHPFFPNSTVTEAIIEVYLESIVSNETLDTIYHTLQSNYSEHHRDQLVSYQATIGKKGMSISQKQQSGQLRLQFMDNNFLIQVFTNRLSVHRISDYNGWNSLINNFFKTWEQVTKIAKEFSGQRVGVRFINKLNEKNVGHPLKKWLKLSPYYPEILLGSNTGFFFRGQWTSNHQTKELRTYTISIAEGGKDNENIRPLMFDIDVVQGCSGKNKNLISDLASVLHEEIWNIFRSSISNDYLNVLKKGK